jgi:hypothetical protein
MLTYDGLNRWVKAGDVEATQLGGSVDDGGCSGANTAKATSGAAPWGEGGPP